jgi:hypothetical protein
MQLFVRTSSGTKVVNAQGTTTIHELKEQMQIKEGIPCDEQHLCHSGRPLADARTVSQYDMSNGSTLDLSLRLLGGAQLGKAVKGRSRDRRKVKDKGPSDEELLLQEKLRRMQEYDKIHQRALRERKRLQALMKTELHNSRVNRLKIQNQWRKIMRLAKLEQLRKDIEILSQSHERDVDRKDAILQMLDRDLEEAEEQYQIANRTHIFNVDKLIDLQDSRLLGLENDFEKELRILEEEFSVERDVIVQTHQQEVAELNAIMSAVEHENADAEAEAKQEHEQLREEIRNRNLEDINVLRITLDSTIEELEQHFETAHLNYLQNTDQRTVDFKHLTSKDQQLSKDIEVKMRKIERLQATLLHWRSKIAQNMKDCRERNKTLSAEKDAIAKHFLNLKTQMNKFRDGQSKRLQELTKNVDKCKTTLKERMKTAETILKLAELARKLQTEREKVAPFYSNSLVEVDQEAAQEQMEAAKGDVEGKDKGVDEWNYLDNFWKRYNKVLLDNLTIEKEHSRLQKENQDLQSILKQYIDGISVNEEVMNALNPLMVVNGRINLNKPQREAGMGQNITVIEGNHAVNANGLF